MIMGASKKDQFSERENEIADFMKAMAHPARIAIMEFLLKQDTCVCGEIVDELPLAQPTVSQHLKELKSAGLIQGTVEGTSVCYCIDEKAVARVRNYFNRFEERLQRKRQQCC